MVTNHDDKRGCLGNSGRMRNNNCMHTETRCQCVSMGMGKAIDPLCTGSGAGSRCKIGESGTGGVVLGGVDASEAVELNRGITMLDACKSCLALDAIPGMHFPRSIINLAVSLPENPALASRHQNRWWCRKG